MPTLRKKLYEEKSYTVRVFEEGIEILDLQVVTNNCSTDVWVIHQWKDNCSAWEPVATAVGAAAFWIWKQTFRDSIFPQLLKRD